ncbi:MAG: hypothetical protein V1926_03495 [Candidatus Peregrinibacteria bacterium]
MVDDITNKVLLEHIQGLRNDLQQQINTLQQQSVGAQKSLQQQISVLAVEMHQGFEEARQHRNALQEDLEETMRVQSKHSALLARR